MIKSKEILQIMLFFFASCSVNQSEHTNALTIPAVISNDQSINERIIDPELIRQFVIRELVIENCLDNSHCFRETYVFNDCGEIETYVPAMVATSWQYLYDENCRLISKMAKGFVRHDYTYLKDDSVQQDVFDIRSEGEEIFTDRYKFKVIETADNYEQKYAGGQLIPDTIGNLEFPCGIEFEGPHKVNYNLYANGLIKSVQYFDGSNTLVVEEAYYYSGRDGVKLEFESEEE